MDGGNSLYESKAREIIRNNKYMTLSTCDKNMNPWAAVVLFVHDDDYNFYFYSAIDSRHSKNITENPKVACVICDSSQPIGSTEEVRLEGIAHILAEEELQEVITLYNNRAFSGSYVPPNVRYRPEDYSGSSVSRFFKIDVKNTCTNTTEGVSIGINLKNTFA